MAESNVQAELRLKASRLGWRLFRNNVGVMRREDGVPVRFGLANDSKQTNTVYKSGDLVGIRPVVITQEMVGKLIGQFVSIEVKHPDWKPSESDERYLAQKRWADLVNSLGGYAVITNRSDTI